MVWWKVLLISIPVIAIIIWLGLPRLLHAIGLHPSYQMPKYELTGKRALVITTSHGTLGDTGKATGVFGSEMTVPYYAFIDAGIDVDIGSIKGGVVPVEPYSMGWPLATPEDRRFKQDADAMQKLNHSIPINQVSADDYDVFYMAGGWGAAYDLAQSEELANLITHANAKNKVLGGVCHGVLGLVSAKNNDGKPLVEGKQVTGVTNRQIKQLGIEVTPKHPETELRKAGAHFEAETATIEMVATHVAVDGNIVTGQNQNSGYEASHRMLELLDKQRHANP